MNSLLSMGQMQLWSLEEKDVLMEEMVHSMISPFYQYISAIKAGLAEFTAKGKIDSKVPHVFEQNI